MSRRYVIISPCRNEADLMRQTLDTVIAQSLRPSKWVIVDDGSTDETPKMQGKPRFDDSEFRKFLRRYQWRALRVGKKRAIEEIHLEKVLGS